MLEVNDSDCVERDLGIDDNDKSGRILGIEHSGSVLRIDILVINSPSILLQEFRTRLLQSQIWPQILNGQGFTCERIGW